jgi:hypothetical protein
VGRETPMVIGEGPFFFEKRIQESRDEFRRGLGVGWCLYLGVNEGIYCC